MKRRVHPYRLVALTALLLTFLLAAVSAHAQEPGSVVLGETSVVVPANGDATIRFQTYCLNFGLSFPTSIGTPDGRVEDNLLRTIKTAIDSDVADSNPLALQLAIWSQVEGQEVGQLYPDITELPAQQAAQQLLDDAADTEVSPLAEDRGIALTDAVSQGLIEATSEDFHFVDTENPRPDGEPYHGEGTLVLHNTTGNPVEVYFPFGTVFRASNEGEQDIVTYATELEQLPTATPAPTATPMPTPDTVPATGGPVAPSNTPWLLLGLGVLLLSAAGVLIVRFQE